MRHEVLFLGVKRRKIQERKGKEAKGMDIDGNRGRRGNEQRGDRSLVENGRQIYSYSVGFFCLKLFFHGFFLVLHSVDLIVLPPTRKNEINST